MSSALSERALSRRLKRHLLKEPQRFMAVCTPGFEDILATEVSALPDVRDAVQLSGGSEFTAPLDTLYHANLQLRSAHRVLLRLKTFLAQSYPMLFDHSRKIPWELYIGFQPSVAIHVSAKRSRIRHHKNIASTVHDAICHALAPLGLKPTLEPRAALEIHLRLHQDRCTLSLNTSGAHLHKRGYRRAVGKAPLRETLGAAIVMSLPTERYGMIYDPMCGSGTLLIEAAQLARQRPPGASRAFAFEQLPFFQASKWARFKRDANEQALTQSPLHLLGSEIDPHMVEAASANAERAGVRRDLTLQCQDVRALSLPDPPEGMRGLLLCNPPYGKRLADKVTTEALYQDLLDHWQQRAHDWDMALLAPEATGLGSRLRQAGLEPVRRFRHGGLSVFLVTNASS